MEDTLAKELADMDYLDVAVWLGGERVAGNPIVCEVICKGRAPKEVLYNETTVLKYEGYETKVARATFHTGFTWSS
jgi:hypothetical protein